MLGGANGNSSTNVTSYLDSETIMPDMQIQVSSLSNLTINGDLELKAGTCEAPGHRLSLNARASDESISSYSVVRVRCRRGWMDKRRADARHRK
jgi:hypothetical protein